MHETIYFEVCKIIRQFVVITIFWGVADAINLQLVIHTAEVNIPYILVDACVTMVEQKR